MPSLLALVTPRSHPGTGQRRAAANQDVTNGDEFGMWGGRGDLDARLVKRPFSADSMLTS
jgi:hypothetical protein